MNKTKKSIWSVLKYSLGRDETRAIFICNLNGESNKYMEQPMKTIILERKKRSNEKRTLSRKGRESDTFIIYLYFERKPNSGSFLRINKAVN